MKLRLLVVLGILITTSLLLMPGCKSDVTEPLWDWNKPYAAPPSPSITQVNPASEVVPGINTITIEGSNFIVPPDTTIIYFDKVQADIVSISNTSITVRRPNITTDSCTIKIVPFRAYLEAKYSPYKVYPVMEEYGSFKDNLELAVTIVDKDENVYVIETASYKIYKITPNGDKTVLGTASRTPTDASFGPDGNLYLVSNSANNRKIDKVDIATGAVTQWTQLPQGKGIAKFGDFDNVNLYAGSTGKAGIFIVPFNDPANVISSGFYSNEEILAVRFFEGFLYVVSRTNSSQPAKIWKHAVNSNSLGEQQLVLDMNGLDSSFSSRTISSITVSSDGKIYISTYDTNSLLVFDLSTSKVDYFYKRIIPDYIKFSTWGTKNFMYIISGNTNLSQTWDVFRVDMGITAATK